MQERDRRYELACTAAEAAHFLLELEYERGERDLNVMMRRLKDLSAYSLIHADFMDRREAVEMLALARFFGMTPGARFQDNQKRLSQLAPEVLEYEGQAEIIEEEVAAREKQQRKQPGNDGREKLQPPLL